jgi:hypothetical protein
MTMRLAAATVAIAAFGLSGTAGATVYPASPTPIALGTATYSQNFNTLANTGSAGTALPDGWQVSENGSNANVAYAVGTGSDNTGNVYSFGSSGSTDRALGSLTSGSLTPAYYGALFTNALGSTIGSLTIGYTGERWRRGGGAADSLTFQYRLGDGSIDSGVWTNVSELAFTPVSTTTTVGALDGNLAANRTVFGGFTIGNLAIASGTTFAIRWSDLDVSGADDGLAIDDVSVLAAPVSAVPEPAGWALMLAGFALTGTMLRRRRAAIAFA